MNVRKSTWSLLIILGIISFLAAGCETFEVGIEPLTTLEPALITQPTQVITPASATPSPKAEIMPTMTSTPEPPPPNAPDLIPIGDLAPFTSPDIGLLTLKNGQLRVEPSPVEYGILWITAPKAASWLTHLNSFILL